MNVETLSPAEILYRQEKAKRAERVQAAVMADAKRALDDRLAREAQLRKGGRPKQQGANAYQLIVGKPGKPHLMVQRRPLVDLVESLEPFFGR